MKKYLMLFFTIVFFNTLFAKGNNEVFIDGCSSINLKEYVQLCDKKASIEDLYVCKYEVTRVEFEQITNIQ